MALKKAELIALIFIAWVSISSSSVLVLLSQTSAFHAAFWRLLFSSFILATATFAYYKKIPFKLSFIPIFSGIFLGFHFLLWMESLFLIPVALSTTIVVTYPGITAILEKFVLKESMGKRRVFGMVVALAGVSIMLYSPQNFNIKEDIYTGSLFSAFASFLAAGYFFLGRIARSRGEGLSQYAITTYLTAAISVFSIGFLKGVSFLSVPPEGWIFLLLLAIVPMIGGHTVMNYLLVEEKASFVSSIALGEPLGATLLSYFILGQRISGYMLIGMVLTIVGMFLIIGERAFSKK